jgi:hypothetical protein
MLGSPGLPSACLDPPLTTRTLVRIGKRLPKPAEQMDIVKWGKRTREYRSGSSKERFR